MVPPEAGEYRAQLGLSLELRESHNISLSSSYLESFWGSGVVGAFALGNRMCYLRRFLVGNQGKGKNEKIFLCIVFDLFSVVDSMWSWWWSFPDFIAR